MPPRRGVRMCGDSGSERLLSESGIRGLPWRLESRRRRAEGAAGDPKRVAPSRKGGKREPACQLQATAYHLGMMSPHYDHFFPNRPVDASHPEVLLDFNRCILCSLCVRASRDVDGKNVFALSGRGITTHLIVNAKSGRLADTNFTLDDMAAQVCPVGVILKKHRGFAVPIGERKYDKAPIAASVATEGR